MTSLFFDGVTEEISKSILLDLCDSKLGMLSRQIRTADLIQISLEIKFPASVGEIFTKRLSRKASKIMNEETVPQTDTGGQLE